MKSLTLVLGILLIANLGFAEETAVLQTEKDKLSYAIGMSIGNNMKRQALELNPEIVTQGIRDSLTGSRTLMTEQEYRDTMTAFEKEMQQKQMTQIKELSEKNKQEGETFLAENKKKDDGLITGCD